MRHRRSWSFEVLSLVVAGLGLVLGCGDDEPAKDQVVFWMALNPARGKSCASAQTFSLPDDTARRVIDGDGNGTRLVDGEDDSLVECSVREASGPRELNVNFNLTKDTIRNLTVSGVLTMTSDSAGAGTFDVSFTTVDFRLQQTGCTATARAGLAGAVWLDELTCPGLGDVSSPSLLCEGTGGLILENCSR